MTGEPGSDARGASRVERIAPLALAALLLLYLLVSLDGLTRYPIVHGDEMWNAAPAWKLATTGIYGSDLFAGFYDADRRTYQFMPVLQLLLAMDFKLFGAGLLQIRLLAVVAGAFVLCLTYAVGRRTGGPRVGLLAVWLLVAVRLASGSEGTGIVLLDFVRQTRYHIVASAFGLASLLAFLRAEAAARSAQSQSRFWPYALCGALAGLAFLSHMYGVFWLPAFAAILLVRRGLAGAARQYFAVLLGFGLVCLPWAIYVAGDRAAYVGQMRMYGERFALSNPWFYVGNALGEVRRYYQFGRRDPSLMGPGTWLFLVSMPLALIHAAHLARKRPTEPLAAVFIALLTMVVLFALLLNWKTFSYLLTPLPLALVLLAHGAVALWDRRSTRMARGIMAALLVVTTLEAGAAVRAQHQRATQTTPYDVVAAQIAAYVPPGATVVAPHRYWLGLRDRRVRTWVVPLLMTNPDTYHAPMALDEALARINPDVLVLDDREFGGYFAGLADPGQPRHWMYLQLQRFLERRDVRLVGEVRDDSYGRIAIYIVRPKPG